MRLIHLANIRIAENLNDTLQPLKMKLEERLNLQAYGDNQRPIMTSNNLVQRLAFIAGLSLSTDRPIEEITPVRLTSGGNHIHDTTFSRSNLQNLWSALLKIRYKNTTIDWDNIPLKSKVVNYEMMRGATYLSQKDHLEDWLLNTISVGKTGKFGEIPRLNLTIGSYEGDIEAKLDLNGRTIQNTQILIAGTTGSGKSNLLAVLLQQIRSASVETAYPVNFLLFDYKGEFSDPQNRAWLSHFETDAAAVLDPIEQPLPFSPFKDFQGKVQNEINLYATELANALSAIDRTQISANMSNRLTEAVIGAYKKTNNRPVTFEGILEAYIARQPEKDRQKDDSIRSVLNQLVRSNLFLKEDKIDLIKDSYIINMSKFPKEGPIGKAIVFFIISKLNNIYEKLPKQAVNTEGVELRHFTIIDEAHYMLGFDNKPLRDLIAVGRNKGLSIILATQNMDSYKSEHFDFFANAQYPLIMKQQSMNDGVIKDLFGVSGKDFQEVKEAIAGLQKGEVLIKNTMAIELGMGKKFKKMKVTHLI
jgi:Helicase HerA, central domain